MVLASVKGENAGRGLFFQPFAIASIGWPSSAPMRSVFLATILLTTSPKLSARVMTALAERDAVIADAERRAGASLKELASSGLSLAEAAQWCDLVGRDAARLVKLAAKPTDAEGASTARENVSGDR